MKQDSKEAGEVSDALLQSEQVRLLTNSIPTGASGNLAAALATLWVLWGSVPTLTLLTWGGVAATAQSVRLAIYAVAKRAPESRSTQQWRSTLRLGVALGGIAWGLLPLLIFPDDAAQQTFLAFVVAGISGAVLVGLASDRVSVLLFAYAAVAPPMLRFLMEGGALLTAVGTLMIPYLIYLTAAAYRSERAFRNALALREKADRDSIALRLARDEADRANQAKSEFLSNMSHELRTPMNAILGFSQLLEMDSKLQAEHQDFVQEILKAGNHLLDLINEILDLAKIESGRFELTLEPVELGSIAEECLSLVRPLAEKKSVQVGFSGQGDVAVRADRTRLKQALVNLLSNAIKYNNEDGKVSLDAQALGDGHLRVKVTDNGPGIPPERQSELFQPFNRLGAEHSGIEGTGIGLTITRRIVEMMGGSMAMESSLGKGSAFWIDLPLESPPPPSPTPATEGEASHPEAPHLHSHTVLYIEDNPVNLKLVSLLLSRRPHIRLLSAPTAEQGIDIARTSPLDLILLDINLPDMNGFEVLNVLKNIESQSDTPIIAVTANAMPADVERGKNAGFTDYLSKPLDLARFQAILDHYL